MLVIGAASQIIGVSMRFFMSAFGKMLVAAVMAAGVVCVAWAAVDPVTVEVHYQNGVKYFKRGLYDKSIQEFEKTLSLDPAHPEAKAYLDKVRAFQKQQKPVEPQVSKDVEVRQLYETGRDLYRRGDYEEARKTFDRVLEIKAVDDFASYYREQCEIYIARKLAREKKVVQKALKKEKAQQEKQRKEDALSEKRAARDQVLSKRAAIKQGARRSNDGQDLGAGKSRAAVEQGEVPTSRRHEKILVKAEREARVRQEKAALSEARKMEKDQALSKKIEKKQDVEKAREERQGHKEIFIRGVEEYGRKEYEAAIASFNEVIEAEKGGARIYSSSARRLKNKAELRLKGVGEDRTIGLTN